VNTRVILVILVVVALVAFGVAGHRIESPNRTQPTPAGSTAPAWVENILADTSEQQTALDNLYADAQLQDAHAVGQDCLSIQDSLGSWTNDEAEITDASIRSSYANTLLQSSQAIAGCNNNDLTAIANHVDAADTYLNATVTTIQAHGWGN